jgi:hypothetical protein
MVAFLTYIENSLLFVPKYETAQACWVFLGWRLANKALGLKIKTQAADGFRRAGRKYCADGKENEAS